MTMQYRAIGSGKSDHAARMSALEGFISRTNREPTQQVTTSVTCFARCFGHTQAQELLNDGATRLDIFLVSCDTRQSRLIGREAGR
jgi:hypothetical protein